jgi:hypothetical protein
MADAIKWEYGVRINVIGHASARWRGARNAAEAQKLNQALSEQRAASVQRVVETVLRTVLPKVSVARAEAGSSGKKLRGFELGAEGVGSRDPLHPGGGPQENDPANRSAVLTLWWGTKRTRPDIQMRSGIIDARSRAWRLDVLNLTTIGVDVAASYIVLRLTNMFSHRSRIYHGTLVGIGIAISDLKKIFDPSKIGPTDLLKIPKIGQPVGSGYFVTDRYVGFDDFNGLWVRVGELDVGIAVPKLKKIGVGYKTGFLSFYSLGPDAMQIVFANSFGLKNGNKAEGAVVTGHISPLEPNPGDTVEVPDMIADFSGTPVVNTSLFSDGVVVMFDTGKASLAGVDRQTVEAFTTNWAKNMKVIGETYDLMHN